jgi:hypothetical protein
MNPENESGEDLGSDSIPKRKDNIMAQAIGTFILIILAIVVLSAVLNFALGLLGIVFALIPLLIKLAIVAGIFYFGWLAVRKLTQSSHV